MKAAFIKSLVELVQNQQNNKGSSSIMCFENLHKRAREVSLDQGAANRLQHRTLKKFRSEQIQEVAVKVEHIQSTSSDNGEEERNLMIVAKTLLSFASEQLTHMTKLQDAEIKLLLVVNVDINQVGVSFSISKNSLKCLPRLYSSMLLRLGIILPEFGNRLVFISVESILLNLMFTKSKVKAFKIFPQFWGGYKEQGNVKESNNELFDNQKLINIKAYPCYPSMSIGDVEFRDYCQIPRFAEVDSKLSVIFPLSLFTGQDLVSNIFIFI
jgi:hypothetical protein